MSFSKLYEQITESEKKISKNLVRPRNIYKITSYEYSDGTKKSLSGPDTSIVFIFGIYDNKYLALKISEIKPDEFFKWLKKLFLKGVSDEQYNQLDRLEEILILSDKKGSTIYNGFIKNKKIGKTNEEIYRTYSIKGVKNISEIKIQKDYLKQYLEKLL